MNWRRRPSRGYDRGYGYPEYVPVALRRSRGVAKAQKKIGKGKTLQPVTIAGTKIAKTFWGMGWCKHFETYSDFSNRLPRGRTYARNGSVAHLEIKSGIIRAFVCGSDLYKIEIKITPLAKQAWKKLCENCTASVTSVIDLMRGQLPVDVVTALTDPSSGMFPGNEEIKLSCDCPDGARLCKHLAAVLYGVGHRLDESPELLFVLRGVKQTDLVGASLNKSVNDLTASTDDSSALVDADLNAMFGIDLVADPGPAAGSKPKKRVAKKKAAKKKAAKKKKVTKKRVAKKKATKKKATKKATAKKKSVKKKAVKKKPAAKKSSSPSKRAK